MLSWSLESLRRTWYLIDSSDETNQKHDPFTAFERYSRELNTSVSQIICDGIHALRNSKGNLRRL